MAPVVLLPQGLAEQALTATIAVAEASTPAESIGAALGRWKA
jgi:hypothetical protein